MTQTENRPASPDAATPSPLRALTPVSDAAAAGARAGTGTGAPPSPITPPAAEGATTAVGAPPSDAQAAPTAPAAAADLAAPTDAAAPTVGTEPPVAAAADHTAWSPRFGATNAGARPLAVGVAGGTVYVGGDFAGPMAGMPEGTYNRIAPGTAPRGTGWARAWTAP